MGRFLCRAFLFCLMMTAGSLLFANEEAVTPPRTADQEQLLKELLRKKSPDRVVMRNPNSDCGIYLRWLRSMGPVGDRVGGFDLEGQDAALDKIEEALTAYVELAKKEGPTPAEQAEDAEVLARDLVPEIKKSWPGPIELYAIGIPWPKKEAAPIIEDLEKLVKEAGLSEVVKIKTVRRPSSNGLARVWEEIVYFAFPIPKDDSEPSTRAEKRQGLASWATSSGITVTLQTIFFGISGLAGAIANSGFSAYTTFNRPMWNNYYGKHTAKFEAWLRQFWMTFYFGAGIYWVSRFFGHDTHSGLATLAEMVTLTGWWTFLWTKLNSTLLGTTWRKPLESGTQQWIEKESREGRGDEARAISAKIRKWATVYSTNLWAISIILAKASDMPLLAAVQKYFGVDISWLGSKVHLLAWDFNIGHAGLIIPAILFGVLAKYPEWYRITEASFRKEKWAAAKVAAEKAVEEMGKNYMRVPPMLP